MRGIGEHQPPSYVFNPDSVLLLHPKKNASTAAKFPYAYMITNARIEQPRMYASAWSVRKSLVEAGRWFT